MRTLYPEIEPFHTEMLKVSPTHDIYVEQSGNPEGQPVIFLHGGPGGGSSPKQRRIFDPAHYRIINFDQRGCGKSNPHAELEANTTWDLVNDIEMIRKQLGIRKWLVYGGSWGSTLALAYATQNHSKILGVVLRGIFLLRKFEIDWFYQNGAGNIFPEFWEEYYNFIPEDERHDLVAAYYKRLTGEDKDMRLKAAKIWSQWEARTSKLIPDQTLIDNFEDPEVALAFARIECHYFTNKGFFDTDNFLLENAHTLNDIPTFIVQGRYDVVCPATSAWDLHKAIKGSQLKIVPDAGHSLWEPGITDAVVEAFDGLRQIKKYD